MVQGAPIPEFDLRREVHGAHDNRLTAMPVYMDRGLRHPCVKRHDARKKGKRPL